MIKVGLYGLLIAICLHGTANASDSDPIHEFLTAVKNNSSQMKVLNLQQKSDLLEHDKDYSDFDWSGSLSLSYDQSEDPQTSPFSSDSSRVYSLSSEASKLFESGLKTTIGYSLVDNLTTFPARDDSDFILPKLSVELSTSLFQDLLSEQWKLVEPKMLEKKKLSTLESRIERKAHLIKALLGLVEILEVTDDLKLQKEVCYQVRKQNRKLSEKKKRGSISKREYLISLKEVNTCNANLKSLEKTLIEKKSEMEVTFGVPESVYSQLTAAALFDRASDIFTSEYYDDSKVNWDANDDLSKIQLNYNILKIAGTQVEADAEPDVSFSIEGGVKGIDSSFTDAHEDIGQYNFPYILASVSLSFPFTDTDSRINVAVNGIQQEIYIERLKQKKKEIRSRFDVLKNSLYKDFSIYHDNQANVKLSREIFLEAQKDFANGRIDLFDLTEFQKSLLESRRRLSSLRTRIVINTVEYVDYFQFFSRYY